MKKVIRIAKNQCPLNVLAKMGEQIKSAWIFFDDSVIENLKLSADERRRSDREIGFHWEGSSDGEYPSTNLWIFYVRNGKNVEGGWYEVSRINASDISFTKPSLDPEEVLFFTMSDIADPFEGMVVIDC